MKTIKLILIAILLTGCSKEDINDCNCGLVVSDGNTNDSYWVDIRSDCSGNVKTWYLTEGDWMQAHPGNDWCITNSKGW